MSVSIEGPDGFVAAIPYLLGVHPHRALVIAGLDSMGAVRRLLHLDLSATEPAEIVAAELVALLAHHETDRVLIAIIDDRAFTPEQSLSHAELADALTASFDTYDIAVARLVWAEATTPGARCRTHTGVGLVPDLGTSPLAVSRVTAGLVTYPDWKSVAADFALDDADTLRCRDDLLQHAPKPSSGDAAQAIRTAIVRTVGGHLPTEDSDIVTLAVALQHPYGLASALQYTADQPALVRELWVSLTRALPAPARAEPAVLASLATYLTGQASIAVVGTLLDLAEHADPDHALTGLLRHATSVGQPPPALAATVRDLVHELTELA